MDINELFFEFSHSGRYKIFKSIGEKEKRHSQLQDELKIEGSEITRHLKRLLNINLIVKSTENLYEISTLGKLFSRVLDFFEITLKHQDFFSKHDFSPIPLQLLLKIGSLKTVETSNKAMENIEIIENLVKESTRFLYVITDQYQKSLLKEVERKIKERSIEIRALVNKSLLKSYNIPEGWSQLFEDSSSFFKKFKIFKNIRILDKIELSLIVSEKGGILFLNREGNIDYSQCLIDMDESFIDWSKELFEIYWTKGSDLRNFV